MKEQMIEKKTGNNPSETKPKGKILRVKYGYNPNSSSAGSVIVFALPVAIFGITLGFGAISSLIMSHFVKAGTDDLNTDKQETGN